MLTHLVMTIIGPDKPGLVRLIAGCLSDHGGNWLESRLSHLGGHFSGIIRAEVDTDQTDALLAALKGLSEDGLSVTAHADGAAGSDTGAVVARLELVGQDRPGILRAVSDVLANNQVNVEELQSERVSAPMGGGTLFQAKIRVTVPATDVLHRVREAFARVAADLMVDIQVCESGPQDGDGN